MVCIVGETILSVNCSKVCLNVSAEMSFGFGENWDDDENTESQFSPTQINRGIGRGFQAAYSGSWSEPNPRDFGTGFGYGSDSYNRPGFGRGRGHLADTSRKPQKDWFNDDDRGPTSSGNSMNGQYDDPSGEVDGEDETVMMVESNKIGRIVGGYDFP